MADKFTEDLKQELDEYRANYGQRFNQLLRQGSVEESLTLSAAESLVTDSLTNCESRAQDKLIQLVEQIQFDTDSNGGVAVDRTRQKNRSLVELKTDVTSVLFDLGPYQPYKGHQVVQYLMLILTKHSHERKAIADFLADLEYAKSITEHMRRITVLDALESDDALTLTKHALILCLNLSGISASFAMSLAKHGAVDLLTLIIMDEQYLRNGETIEEIYSLLRNTVDILNNIARHVPTKQCFVENNTTNALKTLLNWNKGSLKVRAMLMLALVLEEEELLQLTDDTDVIKTIVKWINLACCNEERTHEGFSPSELAEGLTKLATNYFNKSKIIMTGGLIALTKMLSHNDPTEQMTSAECVKTIALDPALRLNILDIRDLVKALLNFRKSQHKHVFCQGLSTLIVLCDKSWGETRITEKLLEQQRISRHQKIVEATENIALTQPVIALPTDSPAPPESCRAVYQPKTLVTNQEERETYHSDILRQSLHDSIDQYVTLLNENSSILLHSKDMMTKKLLQPPDPLVDLCGGMNYQTISQGQNQTDYKQFDSKKSHLPINEGSQQSETFESHFQKNATFYHSDNTVPKLPNNETVQCFDNVISPKQLSEPISSATPQPLTFLPISQNNIAPESNQNHQHEAYFTFAASEIRPTSGIRPKSDDQAPEIPEDSSDRSEDVINAQFLMDYMTFRGKFDTNDPKIKQLLEIINHQNRNEALLNHVLSSECEEIYEALAYYQVYSEQFQAIIINALSLKNTINIQRDQVNSSLTWEQVEHMVCSLLGKFISVENPSNELIFGYQYSLYFMGRVFSTETVEKIGDYLSELQYAGYAVSILRNIKPVHIIERSNELALTGITLCTCMIYSDVSKQFAVKLAQNGMVDILTTHITERCILNNLTDNCMENLVTDFLRLIKNMAYHSDEKQHFKDAKTPEHVKSLPIRDDEILEIIVILILLNTLDEEEFNKMPDETKAIENMIQYMHKAIENKDTRSFHGISLCELTNGISKLAPKFYKINIIHKVEVLSALCKMLHCTDPKEHISSAICLRALVSEADIRKKLKEFPEIVSAMEGLLRNASINVRKYVEEALKSIHLCMNIDSAGQEKEKCVVFHNTESSEGPISADAQASGVANTIVFPRGHHLQNFLSPTDCKMLPQNLDMNKTKRELLHLHEMAMGTQSPINYTVTYHFNQINNNFKQEEQITAKGKSEKIKAEDEDKIVKNWGYLINELDGTHIVDAMLAEGIFDVNDKREIMTPASRQKRTEILLKKLLNAGPSSAFEIFIKILEIDHGHIAEKLKENSCHPPHFQ